MDRFWEQIGSYLTIKNFFVMLKRNNHLQPWGRSRQCFLIIRRTTFAAWSRNCCACDWVKPLGFSTPCPARYHASSNHSRLLDIAPRLNVCFPKNRQSLADSLALVSAPPISPLLRSRTSRLYTSCSRIIALKKIIMSHCFILGEE